MVYKGGGGRGVEKVQETVYVVYERPLKNETKKFPGFPPFPEIKILETVSTLANKHSHLAFQASRKLRETNIPVNEVMCGSFPFLSE